MACSDGESRTWINVPDRSTFHLSIDDADTYSVRLAVNGREVDYEPGDDLTLISPDRYIWWIEVRHGAAPPRVAAHIMKPEGVPYGGEYCTEPDGEPGEVDHVTLTARTRA
jgi:hypothetical protein